ncbi:hypothetical protein [Empedobacter brevis]|uniref:hypothetical protein n=1 Tax=Empedobacter brevis TaxID=247 RepID=UPI0039B0D347
MTVYKSSIYHNIELRIIGYDEPNNGRELHIADIFIDGIKCSDQYFKNKWNRLNFNLEKFKFESRDGKYVFIPAEGYSFIINCDDLSTIYSDFKGVSTINFIQNTFLDDKLQIFYMDEIVEISLK